ncbi:MAG: TIGR01440 family protein [Ruminococcaceae bacterium]|nr:TIGR01440 family protein [Oscillospiraceae bacterium]
MEEIKKQTELAVKEFFDAAKLKAGDILVIGCSSSEIAGHKIGTFSTADLSKEVFEVIFAEAEKHGVFVAAQCCEHLNRALIIDRRCAEKYGLEEVNVVPQIKAGGSLATAAYGAFENPVAVEKIRAHAGMDIGDTLIGMHLREVAVPVRLSIKKIGEANLVCARTRPKFIGGERAVYDKENM